MFSAKFTRYMKECRYSAKDFPELTNISEATISRYKAGKTVPAIDSGKIELISRAFTNAHGQEQSFDDIYNDLMIAAYEDLEVVDYPVYSQKIFRLITGLKINKSKLADEIHISSSYLSKISSGQVQPRNQKRAEHRRRKKSIRICAGINGT